MDFEGVMHLSNDFKSVLYALSPELFPTKDRGTGNALVATANRVFGVIVSVDWNVWTHQLTPSGDCQAPIIALYADLTSSVPIFISGALFLVSGLIALLLPFEPRGKASL